jgi:hypothetical protein
VFSLVNTKDSNHSKASQIVAAQPDPLFISPPVFAEVRASDDWLNRIQPFLGEAGIRVAWAMPESVWDRAGLGVGQYARLRKGGQLPRRILADFLIAAHAEHHQLAVLTFDDTIYKAVFPQVRLIPI